MSNGTFALEDWIFGLPGEQRLTQDSPVLPEVWRRYAEEPGEPQDLLLTPHKDSSAAKLLHALPGHGPRGRKKETGLAYNEGYVVACLDLHRLLSEVIPLSPWWSRIWPPGEERLDPLGETRRRPGRSEAARGDPTTGGLSAPTGWPGSLPWSAGSSWPGRNQKQAKTKPGKDDWFEQWQRLARRGARVMKGLRLGPAKKQDLLWTVSINREARTALSRSRRAVKADAAERVFAIGCKGLRWAIVDTGIDATHPAFRRRDEKGALTELPEAGPGDISRVVATYDFTRLRPIVSGEGGDLSEEEREEVEDRVNKGRAIDWSVLALLLRVTHDSAYEQPGHGHGTHVAGIVGADWRMTDGPEMPAEQDLIGICPDIELYDLRVFKADGTGEEFAIAAALQFIRYLNAHSDMQVIHGANLSLVDRPRRRQLRLRADADLRRVRAAGRPAGSSSRWPRGNEGQRGVHEPRGGRSNGFRTVAITDPATPRA